MASGSFNGGSSYGCYARIAWSSSAGTGGSTVSATLYWVPNGGYYFTYRNGYSLTIDGSSISGSGLTQSGSGAKTLLSHSVWVGYYGSKSVNISGSVDLRTVTNQSTGNKLPIYTVSGTAGLDSVGSPPTVSTITAPTNQTISEVSDTIIVKWNSGTSYNGTGTYHIDVSINGGAYSWVSGEIPWGTKQWSYTIPNKKPGTTYQFRIDTGNNVGWSGHSYSGVVKINEVACGDISMSTIFNPYIAAEDGSNAVLPITFTAGSQAAAGSLYNCAQLYYNDSLVSNTIFKSSENGLLVNVVVPISSYLSKLGTTKYEDNFTIKYWCENQNGTKSTIKQKTFNVDINTDSGAYPTLSLPTLSGGVLGKPSTCFLAGLSSVIVTVPKATLNRAPSGTTVTYKVNMNGVGEKTGQNCTFDNLSAGMKTIVVTATDSRGLSASKTVRCVIQNWAAPNIVITACSRIDDGDTARLSYSMTYSPIYEYPTYDTLGSQLNNIQTQQYRVNAGSWLTATNNMTIPDLNTEVSYNISVRCSDKAQPTTYSRASITVPTIDSLLSLRPQGVGIRCIPDVLYALDVTGDVRISGDSISMTRFGATQKVIEVSGGDSTGLGIKISSGGGMLLGSGESASLFDVNQSEYMYITSDGQINFYTGCNNGLSGAHRTYISAAGNLYCDNSLLVSKYIEVGTTMIVGTTQEEPNNYGKRYLQVGYPNYLARLDVFGDIYGGDIKNPRKVAYADELPKFYVLNGTRIVTFNNANGTLLHTWQQIQEMFQAAYGFTPTKRTALSVTVMNGDTRATQTHIDGACWYYGDSSKDAGDVHVLTDQNYNGAVRINYGYVYCEAGGELD